MAEFVKRVSFMFRHKTPPPSAKDTHDSGPEPNEVRKKSQGLCCQLARSVLPSFCVLGLI